MAISPALETILGTVTGATFSPILIETFKGWRKDRAKSKQQVLDDARAASAARVAADAEVAVARIQSDNETRVWLTNLLKEYQQQVTTIQDKFAGVQEQQFAREQERARIQLRCEMLEGKLNTLEIETNNCRQNNHLLTEELSRLTAEIERLRLLLPRQPAPVPA